MAWEGPKLLPLASTSNCRCAPAPPPARRQLLEYLPSTCRGRQVLAQILSQIQYLASTWPSIWGLEQHLPSTCYPGSLMHNLKPEARL